MRTFIQAAPGTTRSCVGCHEDKKKSFPPLQARAIAQAKPPALPQDESWGSGPLDYPTMVQPILDRHCVACHGGKQGFAAGLDLTGGWTEFFNNSYENLVSRREVQYKSTLIAGVCSMNGTSYYSSQIFPPYAIGSPAAPLGRIVVEGARGHADRFTLSRPERDLLLAWIDANGPYHGTWNYTPRAFKLTEWTDAKKQLTAEMKAAGCTRCHDPGRRFENDWLNLEKPERSRILRAPLAKGGDGLGEALCRDGKVDGFRRLRVFSTGRYEHAVKPLKSFPAQTWRAWDKGPSSGDPVISFENTENAHYRKMLGIIVRARESALKNPRLDMPRGEVFAIAGRHRNIYPVRIPDPPPELTAEQIPGGEVAIRWGLTSKTWGLFVDVYRGDKPDFEIGEKAKIGRTELGVWFDRSKLSTGGHHYAVVFDNGKERSKPVRASVRVDGAKMVDLKPAPVAPAAAVPVVLGPADTVFGEGLPKARRGGDARVEKNVLKTGKNGFLSYGCVPACNLRPGVPLSVSFDVKFAPGGGTMPVLVSAGRWNESGWFVQSIGGKWRWHVGGINCDGGAPPAPGTWMQVRFAWDGKQATIHQDEKPAKQVPCTAKTRPWNGELLVGQYSGGPGPAYQFCGEIRNLKITCRSGKP
jgi:hypothetical protein